jgi:hypothetical protein
MKVACPDFLIQSSDSTIIKPACADYPIIQDFTAKKLHFLRNYSIENKQIQINFYPC